jgi:hypothetical protein
LKVFLAGKKLKGVWLLKRTSDGTESDAKSAWLLIKIEGDAKKIPARRLDISAVSERTIEEIANQKTAVWET